MDFCSARTKASQKAPRCAGNPLCCEALPLFARRCASRPQSSPSVMPPVADQQVESWSTPHQPGECGVASPSPTSSVSTPPSSPIPPAFAVMSSPPRPVSPGLDIALPPAILALRNTASRHFSKTTCARFACSSPKAMLEIRKSPASRLKQRMADHQRASAHRMEAELLSQRLNKSMKM